MTSTTNGSYADVSNGSFSITAPVATSIRVTSPNGGEIWRAGDTQTIRWTYTGSPGTSVKTDLFARGSLYDTITSSALVGSNGSGSYAWKILYTQEPGTEYQVRITSTSDSSYRDQSDAYFTIE